MEKFGVIFDMDGVIVDSNPFHKIALKQFCKKHGYDLSEDDLRAKIYGRTNKDWITNLFGKLEKDQLKSYADEKEALFRDLFKSDIKALVGLEDFLETLNRNNIPRAIATSAPRANVDFTLAHTGLEQYFTVILDDTFVTHGKPDPEIYIKSAKALGLDPRNCIVIEDSISGIQAGKAAGSKVIGVTTTHTPQEMGTTDLVIGDFTSLSIDALRELVN